MKKIMFSLVMAAVILVGSTGQTFAQAGGTYRLDAYSTHTFTQSYYCGGWATVVMKGDGDTDLDLFIVDQFGNPVGADTRYSDFGQVRFFVPCTAYSSIGTYRITVVNRGGVYNVYRIVTN